MLPSGQAPNAAPKTSAAKARAKAKAKAKAAAGHASAQEVGPKKLEDVKAELREQLSTIYSCS